MKTLTFSLYPWNLYLMYAAIAAVLVTAVVLLKHLLMLGKAAQSMQKSAEHLNQTLDHINLQTAQINALLTADPSEAQKRINNRRIATAAASVHKAYKVYSKTAGKKHLPSLAVKLLKLLPKKKLR